jgi:hypothetical protein
MTKRLQSHGKQVLRVGEVTANDLIPLEVLMFDSRVESYALSSVVDGKSLGPYFSRDLDDQLQLSPLIVPGKQISRRSRGETTLGAQ